MIQSSPRSWRQIQFWQWLVTAGILTAVFFGVRQDYLNLLTKIGRLEKFAPRRFNTSETDMNFKTKVMNVNSSLPDFDPLMDFARGRDSLDEKILKEYAAYYGQAIELLPFKSDSYALLGFCEYRLGRNHEALEAYRQSIENNTNFFWSYYNLALVLFKSGKFENAAEIFKKALERNYVFTLKIIMTSKIYKQIRIHGVSDEDLAQNLKDAYERTYRLLLLSEFHLRRFDNVLKLAQDALAQPISRKDFFHYYAGLALFHTRHYREAADRLLKSVQINPANENALAFLAKIWETLGDNQQSSEFLQAAQKAKSLPHPLPMKEEDAALRIF